MLNWSSVQCVVLSPQSQELVITHKYLTNPCWTILAMQYLDVRPLNTRNAILKNETLDNMNDTVKSELKHVCMRTHFCKTKSIMMIDDAATMLEMS